MHKNYHKNFANLKLILLGLSISELASRKSLFSLLFLALFLISILSCGILDSDDRHNWGIEPMGRMPSPYQDVSISVDGQKIIFYRTKYTYVSKDRFNIQYDPDSTGIWICNIDGSDLKLIYNNNKDYIGRPQFIPNSNYILFNINSQLAKAPYNGKLIEDNEIMFLTSNGNNFFPSVNGDGSLIAFDSNNDSPNGMYFIWTMDIDGSNKKRIVYMPEKGEIRMPSFYPSINFIVHNRAILEAAGGPEIFIMDKNGNNHKRITFNSTWDEQPRINFNDSKILFTSDDDSHLVITDIDSSSSYHSIPGTVQSACWTPTDKIVHIPYLGYTINSGTVWIMNEDGTNNKQITHNYGLVLEGGELRNERKINCRQCGGTH